MPVIVKVRVPLVALLLTVIVRVEEPEPATEVGLNRVVTREPCPLALKLTVPLNPLTAAIVTLEVPLVPRVTVMLAGESEIVKFGLGPLTVRVIVVVWVIVPEVPVMVTVLVPAAAVLLATNVTVLVEVVGFVPKLAVTPAGRPDADKLTLPVKPPEFVTVIVLLPLPPCETATLAGEAEREKLGVDGAGGKTQLFAALENSN